MSEVKSVARRWYFGQNTVGANNPRARLTDENVMDIIESDNGTAQACAKLSKKYGISKEYVRAISSGKRWKHLHRQLKSGQAVED